MATAAARNRPVLTDPVEDLWERLAMRNGLFYHGSVYEDGPVNAVAGAGWTPVCSLTGIEPPGSQLDTPDRTDTLLFVGFWCKTTPSGGSDDDLGLKLYVDGSGAGALTLFETLTQVSSLVAQSWYPTPVPTVTGNTFDRFLGSSAETAALEDQQLPYMAPFRIGNSSGGFLDSPLNVHLAVTGSTDVSLAVTNALLVVASA